MPSQPIVINDPSLWKERRTVRKNGTLGKARVSIEVEAEPIVHNFDARIGAPAAEAIREVIAEGIRNITAVAKPATLAARQVAYNAYQRGERWAKKRFSGGRIGETPPDPTKVRLFNNSGRLANNLFTRWNQGDRSFTTNVPANRFDEQVWTDAKKKWVLERLSQLVPALTQVGRLMNDKRVQAGLNESLDLLMAKLKKTKDLKLAERRRLQIQIAKQVLGLTGLF